MKFRNPILGLFAASIVSSGMFAVFTRIADRSGIHSPGYFLAALLVGLQFSAIIIIVIALPLILILRYLQVLNSWWILVSGFVIGVIVAVTTEWPENTFSDFFQMNWSHYS